MNSDNEIRKQFKSKFNDFKVPVPADGWDQIEESLNSIGVVQNHNIRRIWRIVGSVAAMLIFLIGSLVFLNKSNIVSDKSIMSEVVPSNHKIETPETEPQLLAEELLTERRVVNKVSKQTSNPSSTVYDFIEQEKQLISDDLLSLGHDVTTIEDDVLYDTYDSGDYNTTEEQLVIVEDQKVLLAENEIISEKENYILSFGGKGGLTSFHQTINSPMTLRSAVLTEENQQIGQPGKAIFQSASNIDNTLEMEHNQPISFGITVSKSVSEVLYIETGLIYSYLYSKRKNTSPNSLVERKQQFHYLGIPLNVNYNLFSLSKLNVYASVGGMIEKDVYGRLKEVSENQFIGDNGESEELIDKPISQRNPQLSVNAGIGLSYPIYQNVKLYGKIGGAYYFDANNQYPTIFLDSKIVMDLNFGIRYEF